MTTGAKALIGVIAGGVLYLILAKRSEPFTVPGTDAARVMQYAGYLRRYGAETGIDPALLAAIMTVESRGKADATGRAGEIGLMQISPDTAMAYGAANPEHVRIASINIQMGAIILRDSIAQLGGNVPAGIAGYNLGPGRVVIQGGRIIVPDSVARYVQKVLDLVPLYRGLLQQNLGGLNCRTCHAS